MSGRRAYVGEHYRTFIRLAWRAISASSSGSSAQAVALASSNGSWRSSRMPVLFISQGTGVMPRCRYKSTRNSWWALLMVMVQQISWRRSVRIFGSRSTSITFRRNLQTFPARTFQRLMRSLAIQFPLRFAANSGHRQSKPGMKPLSHSLQNAFSLCATRISSPTPSASSTPSPPSSARTTSTRTGPPAAPRLSARPAPPGATCPRTKPVR